MLAFLFRGVAALMLALAAGAALASGSDGSGATDNFDVTAYHRGKQIYTQKLACSGCPMDGKRLNSDTARELLSSDLSARLTSDEAKALAVYLTRRFWL